MAHPLEVVFFCRNLDDPQAEAKFERFDKLAREANYALTAKVGQGFSWYAITAESTARLIQDTLPREPTFLTAAGK